MSVEKYKPSTEEVAKAEEMLESHLDLKDLTRHREEAVSSETFQSLQKSLEKSKDVILDTGYDLRDGSGLVAKLNGKKGGEVMFFEWDNYSDEGKHIGRDVPSERMRELGAKLAEKLESGDTLKLGPTENDVLLHTANPERVLGVLSEIGIQPSEEVEPPSQGYKRHTIRFHFE